MSDSAVGRKIGHYQLQEVIGRGGMAVVYRAAQPRIDRDVAIKIIAAQYAHHPSFVRHFEREIRAVARLQHPHILPVYDVSLEGDDLYMVMAYLPGGTVSRRIATTPGGLPLADAICIATQVASALDYAHAQGIVHRDVKPGNILLDMHGNAYLSDFGIAQVTEGDNPPALGTYAYMAPELLNGDRATPASDIYSLGVVAFEMLAGERPFEAHDRDALLDLRARVGIPNLLDLRPDLPHGLQVVLTQALAEDPAGRPPHASSLAAALHRASGLSGLPCAETMASELEDADSGEWLRPSRQAFSVPIGDDEDEDDEDEDEDTLDSLAPVVIDDEDDPLDDPDELPDLDDHPLVRTPLPFADDIPAPPPVHTDPSAMRDGRLPVLAPPTVTVQPAPPPAAAPPRRSIGPLLVGVWLAVILALLAVAVLAVALISQAK